LKTYHIFAVHRDLSGGIVSVRFLERGCRCISRAELLHCLQNRCPVRITVLSGGQWRDSGKVCWCNGALCLKGESAQKEGLAVLPDY